MAFPDDLEWNQPGVEPTQAKKDEGWKPEEKPPAEYFNWFFNRTSQAVKYLKGESDKLIDDAKIGNRTITDTLTAAAGAGTLTNLLNKLGNMIKRITGKSNWYTAPAITLEDVSNHTTANSAAHAASAISSTATGDVAATNVQAAIAELASEKLALGGGDMKGAINETMVTMASAATMAIGAAAGNLISVTGTTTIISFDTVQAGVNRTLRFASPLTITHNALSLILPGNVNIVVGTGDVMEFASFGNGNWRCTNYQPNAGYAPAGYGLGASVLLTSTDLNTIHNSGFYYAGNSCTNRPPRVTVNGHFLVLDNIGSVTTQFYIEAAIGTIYNRVYSGTAWSSWKQIATTDYYNYSTEITASDWNNLTINGKYYVIGMSALAINGPLPAGDANHLFYVDVINGTSTRTNYVSQHATSVVTGVIYTRKNQGGTWSAWKQIPTSDLVAPAGYGLGGYATSVSDANLAVLSGFYRINGASSGGLNIPTETGSATAYIFVETIDNANVKQTLFNRSNGNIYVRHMFVNAWSAWKQIATTDLIPAGAGAVKAHVNFSYEGGVITIRNSFNVSSVVRTSGGQYTINFAAPLASANYTVQCTAVGLGTGVRQGLVTSEYMSAANTYGTKTANAIAILTVTNNDSDTTVADVGSCNVTILQ